MLQAIHTITATFAVDTVQYQVSFAQTGSAADVIVSYQINSGGAQQGTAPFNFMADEGSSISYSYPATVDGATGVRYSLTGTNLASPQIMGASDVSVSATYKTQYQVTFDVSANVKGDSTVTVVTAGGVARTGAQLPYTEWYDASSSLAYSYASPIASSGAPSTTSYMWSSTGGLSQTVQANTFDVGGSGTITGTYTTRTAANLIQNAGFESDSTWTETSGSGGSADRYSTSYERSGSHCGHTATQNPSGSNSYAILTQTLTSTPVSSIVDTSGSLTAYLRRPSTGSDGTDTVQLRIIAGSTTLSYIWCA